MADGNLVDGKLYSTSVSFFKMLAGSLASAIACAFISHKINFADQIFFRTFSSKIKVHASNQK